LNTCEVSGLVPEQVSVAYRVVCHAGGTPEPGQLLIGPDSVRLLDREGDNVIAELPFDDLKAIRLPPTPKRRQPIVLESRRGQWIEIESALDWSFLPHLLQLVASHLLAATVPHQQLLLCVRLRPDRLRYAGELLRDARAFSAMPDSLRDVFILDDEVLFLFARDDDDSSEHETGLWEAVAAWHEAIVEIGIAEHARLSRRGSTRSGRNPCLTARAAPPGEILACTPRTRRSR
jgi:hypothetical protein